MRRAAPRRQGLKVYYARGLLQAEQPILAPDHERPDRTLGGVVVDRQVTGFGVEHQLGPVDGPVADGFAPRRHLWLGFLQPGVQLSQQRQTIILSAFVAMFIADFFYSLDTVQFVDQIQGDIRAPGLAFVLQLLRFDELVSRIYPTAHTLDTRLYP